MSQPPYLPWPLFSRSSVAAFDRSLTLKDRAVRMVLEHAAEHPSQWAAMEAIAPKLGCTSETLRKWVRQAERDAGQRPGLTTEERERLKVLERENRELSRPNRFVP